MNMQFRCPSALVLATALALACVDAAAFDSGSTGADGNLNPVADVQIALPPNGVLHYGSIAIPPGVTVTFTRNTTNTPVVFLVAGDATIAGTIDVSGSAAADSGAAGDGVIADDGTPGLGGPGGFDGGQGGRGGGEAADRESQAGLGPGGGGRSIFGEFPCGGDGAGHGAIGADGFSNSRCFNSTGAIYGVPDLLPLVGGSGGGGGSGGTGFRGAGGGGGGGALLMAVSGTLTITGELRADGGGGGRIAGLGSGGAGGGGSGGAIRLMASTLTGDGSVSAMGGSAQFAPMPDNPVQEGGRGAVGRVRLEAEVYTRTAASTPVHTFGQPGPVFIAGLPSLRISKVGGIDAPDQPTGDADVALPVGTTNPVTVEVSTVNVPLGNTATVVVTPAFGAPTSHTSGPLSGALANALATVEVTLPAGPSTLLATISYDVPAVAAASSPLRDIAGADDPIARISLTALPDGSLHRMAISRSGREYPLTGAVSSETSR